MRRSITIRVPIDRRAARTLHPNPIALDCGVQVAAAAGLSTPYAGGCLSHRHALSRRPAAVTRHLRPRRLGCTPSARRSNRDVDRGAVALVRRRYSQRRQDDLNFRAVRCSDIDLPAVAINRCDLAGNDVMHHAASDAGVSRRPR